MCKPFVYEKNFINGAHCEIISAMSSLNMEPSPLKLSEEEAAASHNYLSETDFWVRHAMEHLYGVCDTLSKAAETKHQCSTAVYKLWREVRKGDPNALDADFEHILDMLENI